MDRLRRKADEERRKYEEMMRRAKIYDHEMHEKEAAFKKEEAERNAALTYHQTLGPKKFRVLQENPMRSISETTLDGPTTRPF
ncbi:unnamed protein product [Caenorhabditis bovis]|uniref:Uncharacterized protein n=1 Tax=Caenorhabditis bovis TaxID=2654633 RepID=A0A8S1EZT8_9PELO|nr:unnamed protein product [Caenorhabditis bovis]